jgi:hypothetical protein
MQRRTSREWQPAFTLFVESELVLAGATTLRSAEMKSFLLTILLLTSTLGYVHAGNKDYRDYLTSIDGFDLWFRIGSYSLTVNGTSIPVDLYYFDSDARPDGTPPKRTTYPNSFGLYCVWRDATGEWHHKEVAGAGRCTFHRIVLAEVDRIELELRPKFQIIIKDGEDIVSQWKRGEEINKPHKNILTFHDGLPKLVEAQPIDAEQAGTGQPATRPESKSEGSDKPQPEADGRFR